MGYYEAHVINQVEGCGKNAEWPAGRNSQNATIDMDDSWIIIIGAGKANHANEKLAYKPLKYRRIR